MFEITVIAIVLVLPAVIYSQSCPEEYLRLSREHSFCKPANSQCQFLARGIQDKSDIVDIQRIHNDYRNKVATGDEKKGGRLPTASNMIQLTWDEDLAAVAQKWAEQCKFQHDCGPCRATKSYGAGQNIAYTGYSCSGQCEVKKPDWYKIITMWYDEVKDFNKGLIKAIDFNGQPMIGHFTQVIWAETYKVGCGYVSYTEDGWGKQFYVCNYGPAGNMYKAPIYIEGPTCSACPLNSCCGNKCQGGISYPGLCRLNSPPPVYTAKQNQPFSCSFEERDSNCEFTTEGSGKSELTKTYSGTYLTTVVSRGSFLINFKKTVRGRSGMCMNLYFRKGPNVSGDREENKLEVIFERNGRKEAPQDVWSYPSTDFIQSPVQIQSDGDLKFSLKFSVANGAPAQYLQIKKIEITNEGCHYGK